MKVHKALYDYNAQRSDELSFKEGDIIYVLDMISDRNWWKAKIGNEVGLIPSNYSKTKKIEDLNFVLSIIDTFCPINKNHKQIIFCCCLVEENTENYVNPMHDAAKRGNIEFLKECLDNKVSANSLDKAGNTPLHWVKKKLVY